MKLRHLLWFGLATLALGSSGLAQKAQVLFWEFGTGDLEVSAWKDLIADFQKQNPDIEVKMEVVPWADQQQRIVTALTAGGLPDVSYMGNNVVAQFQAIGALEPLDRYIADWSKAEGSDVTKDYYPGDIGYYRIKGQYWGAPLAVETRSLYYRKDLFRQAGLDPNKPPRTWDELISAAAKLQKGDTYGWAVPMSIDYNTVQVFMSMYLGYGARMLGPDGKCGFNTDDFKAALSRFTGVFKKGTPPDAATADGNTASRYFQDGKAAMYISGPWTYATLKSQKAPFLSEVGIAPIPAGPKTRAGFLGGWPLVMWKAAKDKEATAKFIGYATSPKGGLEKFARAAGLLPARRSLARQAPWNAFPYTVYTAQLEYARPYQYPSEAIAQMGQLETRTIQTAVQQVALGQKDVNAATADLCSNINDLLQK